MYPLGEHIIISFGQRRLDGRGRRFSAFYFAFVFFAVNRHGKHDGVRCGKPTCETGKRLLPMSAEYGGAGCKNAEE